MAPAVPRRNPATSRPGRTTSSFYPGLKETGRGSPASAGMSPLEGTAIRGGEPRGNGTWDRVRQGATCPASLRPQGPGKPRGPEKAWGRLGLLGRRTATQSCLAVSTGFPGLGLAEKPSHFRTPMLSQRWTPYREGPAPPPQALLPGTTRGGRDTGKAQPGSTPQNDSHPCGKHPRTKKTPGEGPGAASSLPLVTGLHPQLTPPPPCRVL